MSEQTVSKLRNELHTQALADPGLPKPNPTTSFWQLPPHPTLSDTCSENFPESTDYVIIGSGITGCSIAKHLLELSTSSSNAFSVTVLEARTLTSGATGRNGGALTSFVPSDYGELSEHFGHDQAIKIARFANRTLDKMHELGNSSDELKAAGEVRRTLDVICFEDEESFLQSQKTLRLYEEHVPEERGKGQILNGEELEKKYNMRGVGAIIFPNGAFWPYRLITNIWAQLHAKYQSRFSIETNSPVTEITYDQDSNSARPYVLDTPRGRIRASHVIHATNGFTGHLLPELRGKIFPLRGTMSTQKAPPEFGDHGSELSWSVVHSGKFDAATNILETGLYYSNQNPKTRDIFIGGEKAYLNELLISDDTQVGRPCLENISTVLPRYFTRGWDQSIQPEVRKVWSGIMGFTSDRLPLVGRLSASVTHRCKEDEGSEWIAAGFNGYGMPLCWSCGEAVAKMLLGLDVSDFMPEVFHVTKERLEDERRMSTVDALAALLGGH